jgi:hypothetical protein
VTPVIPQSSFTRRQLAALVGRRALQAARRRRAFRDPEAERPFAARSGPFDEDAMRELMGRAQLLPMEATGHEYFPRHTWDVVVPAILRHTS